MSGGDTTETVQFKLSTLATSAAKGSAPIPSSNYSATMALLSPFASWPWSRYRDDGDMPAGRTTGGGCICLCWPPRVMGIAGCGSSSSSSAKNQVPLGTSTVATTASATGGANARSLGRNHDHHHGMKDRFFLRPSRSRSLAAKDAKDSAKARDPIFPNAGRNDFST
jgi:hypothetical protein